MRDQLYKLTFILALGTSLAWGQTAAQGAPQTSAKPAVQAQNPAGAQGQSTIPMNEQKPSAAPTAQTQNPPAQSAGQSTQPSSSSTPDQAQPAQPSSSSTPVQAQPAQASTLPQTDAVPAGDLQGTIQSALQKEPSLKDSSITVNQKDSGIELTGTAANRQQKKTAEQIAKANANGKPVMNHIKVTGASHHNR